MDQRFYIASISEDAAPLAKAYGVGLELDHYCTAQNMDDRFSQTDHIVRQEITSAGNPLLIFHAPFNELHPAAIDPKVKQIAKERYEQAYKIATGYGIQKMVVHSGYLPHVYFKTWHHDRSVEFWRSYMEGKPEDFTIYIENVLEDEPHMMRNIAEELNHSNIKLCLDVGHANVMGEVPVEEWIEVMGPYLRHLHIHNNDGKLDSHHSLCDGTLLMERVLDAVDTYCSTETTITVESIEGRRSLEWLCKRGYLK